MNIKGMLKKVSYIAIPGLLATLPLHLHAAGYKMEFQSVSVMGGGGEAAVLEDAGTNWYNSAGDVYMPKQLVLSSFDVYVPTTFSGTATAPSPYDAVLPHPLFPLYGYSATGSSSAHTNTIIPSMHGTYPINQTFALGLSVVPAWGFREDYSSHSILRYTLQSIYTRTFDIAPSLAIKLNDQWSIGFGPDFNYFTVQSESSVRTQGPQTMPSPPFPPNTPLPPDVPPGTLGDSIQRFTGEQWKTGWHAGILLRSSETTRVGLNYRSKIIMDLQGSSGFSVYNGPTYQSNDFSIRVPLPEVVTLSVYHDFTPNWAMTGTIAYDRWSVNQAYHATNIVSPPTTSSSPTLNDVSLEQNFGNTLDYTIGTHYKVNDRLMLRGLMRYVDTPTNNADRDVNFPDAPKFGIHIGSRYQMTQAAAIDLVYGHAWTWEVPVNSTNPLTGANANGHLNSHVDFAGVQFVINI